MKARSVDFRSAALFGLLLSLPFALLEVAFRGFVKPDTRFVLHPDWLLGALGLFGFLWTLPFIFASIGQPLLRVLRIDPRALTRPPMMARVVGLVLIALLWGTLVYDQVPCFLAVPNCD